MSESAYMQAVEVVHREAVSLDERRWNDWLAFYREDCEFWMPMWSHEDKLIDDPMAGLSHIYYANRSGLEDRVARITSRKSPASQPLPRTAHVIGTHLLLSATAETMTLQSNWSCHVVFPRHREPYAFFGSYRHDLVKTGDGWRIKRKFIALLNDYVPTMLDVYCV